MNRRSSLAATSVIAAAVLGLLTNGISSHPIVDRWFQDHVGTVITVGILCVLVAIFAESSNTVEQALESGNRISRGEMAAAIFTGILVAGVGGAAFGLVASLWIWPWAAEVTPKILPGVWRFLVEAGPLAVTCIVTGAFEGEKLRLIRPRLSIGASFAGLVAGGGAGWIGASYFAGMQSLSLPNGWGVNVPAFGGAVVGGLIGGIVAVFEPRADADKVRRQESQTSEWAQFERTVSKLRRLGHQVRYNEAGSGIRGLWFDLVFKYWFVDLKPAVRARIRKEAPRHDFDRFIKGCIAIMLDELGGENREEVKVSEDVMLEEFFSSPLYPAMKFAYGFVKPPTPLHAAPPPYVIIDDQGHEHRLHSLAALFGYAEDVFRDTPISH